MEDMRTLAAIPTDAEELSKQKDVLRECRERETFAHNAVNDAEEAYRKAENELNAASYRLERAHFHLELARKNLATIESAVKK